MPHVNTHAEENRLFDWFKATTGRAWDSFSKVESAAWKAYQFDLAVQNGGFEKGVLDFGDHWRDLLDSLQIIGAVKIAEMCKQVGAVFPNGCPAIDTERRYKEMWELDQAAKDLLWRLGGDYYDLYRTDPGEDIYSKMYATLKNENVL